MINVDTNKMRECGNDIDLLIKEANDIVNDIFLKIDNMPLKTREWIGSTSMQFSKQVKMQQYNYTNFFKNLDKMNQNLINNANRYDNAIKRSVN